MWQMRLISTDGYSFVFFSFYIAFIPPPLFSFRFPLAYSVDLLVAIVFVFHCLCIPLPLSLIITVRFPSQDCSLYWRLRTFEMARAHLSPLIKAQVKGRTFFSNLISISQVEKLTAAGGNVITTTRRTIISSSPIIIPRKPPRSNVNIRYSPWMNNYFSSKASSQSSSSYTSVVDQTPSLGVRKPKNTLKIFFFSLL